jgi:hypothetical protein
VLHTSITPVVPNFNITFRSPLPPPSCSSPYLLEPLQHSSMSLMVSVAEVEARHIEPSIQQRRQPLLTPAGGPQCADNLGLAAQGHILHATRAHSSSRQTVNSTMDAHGSGTPG